MQTHRQFVKHSASSSLPESLLHWVDRRLHFFIENLVQRCLVFNFFKTLILDQTKSHLYFFILVRSVTYNTRIVDFINFLTLNREF